VIGDDSKSLRYTFLPQVRIHDTSRPMLREREGKVDRKRCLPFARKRGNNQKYLWRPSILARQAY
jgi:hypothetical protein